MAAAKFTPDAQRVVLGRLSPDAGATAPTDHLTVNLYPRLIVATRWVARMGGTHRHQSRHLQNPGASRHLCRGVCCSSQRRAPTIGREQAALRGRFRGLGWQLRRDDMAEHQKVAPSLAPQHHDVPSLIIWRHSEQRDAFACQLVAVSTDAHSHQTTTLRLSH
jgi:hypothetical protein